jgi:2-oxoglutarate dehydrogenase E1 component
MNEQLRPVLPPVPETTGTADAFAGVGDPGALEAYYAHLGGEATAAGPRRGWRRPSTGGAGEAALIQAYRDRGFLRARLDPLGLANVPDVPELAPALYGLDAEDAGRLVQRMEATYCGPIGWEFGHIHDATRRRWLEGHAETPDVNALGGGERDDILALLTRAHTFETALIQRLPGAKLFGIGGAETLILLLETALKESVRLGVDEVVVGGMHRGRFNVLANVFGKPLPAMIAEIQGTPAVPEGLGVSSDVSYHLGFSGERDIAGRRVKISVSPHPSHLQLVPIIAQGRARAKQGRRGAAGRGAVLPLLLHTDASFAGQGLVAEMFQLSGVAPFDIGGTIHVVINNQVGFTTAPEEGRTARHPTDIAKLIEAPVLHVNGDDPEAVYRVALVAANWRATFASDIVIDLVCYRRMGHNEIDEPRFTQPAMYRAIDARAPVHALYADALPGSRTPARVTEAVTAEIRAGFEAARSYAVNHADWFEGTWAGLKPGTADDLLSSPATGVALDRLKAIGARLTAPPAGFTADAKVEKFLAERRRSLETGTGLTWATAEAMALASLLDEGTSVRFGGQDSVRGAFTQRHLELHDAASGARHLPIAGAAQKGAVAEVHNTPLIEHAVLCYEYGLSLSDPRRLIIWEAQFGEFLNIAQPVFDQCIACGEDRWLRASGLVILLPHGLDGGGPDHSTGRPERLLAACAGANMIVANVSTPANFFHLLRRQMTWPYRKPLVVLTPKALLRHKACVSNLGAFGPGNGFRTLIPDDRVVEGARRVVLCTGKVFYELAEERVERGLAEQVALVRVEQLHPFPEAELAAHLARHPKAEIVWCEEEPENMGYFTRLDRTLERAAGRRVRRAGRPAAATPAVGVKAWLEAEREKLMEDALGSA